MKKIKHFNKKPLFIYIIGFSAVVILNIALYFFIGGAMQPNSSPDRQTVMSHTNDYTVSTPVNNFVREITLNLDKPGVHINNETKYKVDINEILSEKPNILNKNGNTDILIIHTHTNESYGAKIPDGNNCVSNDSMSITAVGERLAETLRSYGFNVIHDITRHNEQSYTGAYSRSLAAIEKHKTENPNIGIILDIHRDSIEYNGYTYSPVIIAGNRKAAQIMLVVGTDEGGLHHPNWRDNLGLAVHLQSMLQFDYPGLSRCINLRRERFNQHVSPGTLLIEIGAEANELEEALYSAEILGNCLGKIMQK